ncbi:phosphoribosylaminoimidazolesuccinocarboxamide synthase [Desulfonema magnum]|uniref:Phosphoribosylaminoimidazole-succinocarboxamide synthase n=1 Tax=Desulfonema magnum TaxID=45655 RepID=A0A975BQQ7_9BACT|nr:Phosphoribosylaminoimidazole-succinocarboxamide synthase [Desulfonema magnum]
MKNTDITEKRRHIRIDSLNLSHIWVDEMGEGIGRTLNVSESGILLETYFYPGLEEFLILTIAFEDKLLEIKGKVVHYKSREGGRFETGIEFLETDDSAVRFLKKFIKRFRERTVFESDFKELNLVKRGKVRDIYDLGDSLLMVATDRISAFDVIMPNPIPEKGKILTQISLFWFEIMKPLVGNHVISGNADDYPDVCRPYADMLRERSMLVKKAEPLPIECVVRGYISGSGWKSYQESGTVCGIKLPDGLKESDKLPEPIFTPSTKEEVGTHDINIDFEETVRKIGKPLAEKVKSLSLEIYNKGAEVADKQGIIIADTKFEFGLVGDEVILIDEILTPDSSRFWPKASYKPGGAQKSFDKQYVRDYLISINWNKEPPAPSLPEDVVENTRKKYLEALRNLKA